jgi:hypothetical protein
VDPVSRVERIAQQLRSFAALHAGELSQLADKLETGRDPGSAARVRLFLKLQAQECALVIDELTDLSRELAGRSAT